MNKFIKGTRPI